MEKRIILAFVLSFIILISWQAMFPAPKSDNTTKFSQHIENKEDKKRRPFETAQKEQDFEEKQSLNIPEKTIVISSSEIEALMSTKGGAIVETKILKYDAVLPVTRIFELADFNSLSYTIEEEAKDRVVFLAKTKNLEIRKRYQIPQGGHLVNADIQIKNTGRNAVAVNSDVQAMVVDIGMLEEGETQGRDRNLLEYSVFKDGKVWRKTGAYQFTEKDQKKEFGGAEWFGFRNRYYCAIFKPDFDVTGHEILPKSKENLQINVDLSDKTLSSGETITLSSVIYIGPQQGDILASYNMDFEKIHVYFKWGFFDAIAKIIEDLIKFTHKFIPNWGVSIILVSLAIYFSFYPLTMKSMLSMRKMQSLQPKIMEIREKYEKNPQKLNQETMKLYAENKVNPLGGCLPLLLQMPIFICLYQMIWRSVLFKGAKFLWIKDLSGPDKLIVLDKSFPIIGNEINILPLFILILMFIQQKMTAKNMNVKDPNQIAQQKMMTFMMPAILFFVFYHIASGLTLYFTVFYIVSSFAQWRIGKKAEAMS